MLGILARWLRHVECDQGLVGEAYMPATYSQGKYTMRIRRSCWRASSVAKSVPLRVLSKFCVAAIAEGFGF